MKLLNQYADRSYLTYSLPILALVLLSIFWLMPKGFVVFPNQGLDWSWIAAVNWAYQQEETFGQDFVFTYGPLGWLVTRVDFLLPKMELFLFDVFLYTSLGIALYRIFVRFPSLTTGYRALGALFSIYFLALQSDPLILMMLLLLVSLFEHQRTPSVGWLLLVVGICTLGFFIKLNTAFIYLLHFGLYVLFQLIWGREGRSKVIVWGLFLGNLGLIWLFSQFLKVDLVGYISYGLKIISGYQDGMQLFAVFLDTHKRSALPALVLGIALAVILWVGGLFSLHRWWNQPFDGFIWVNLSISFFVIFKHAFTYYTPGPANEVFTTAPALLGLGFLYIQDRKVQLLRKKVLSVVALFSILGVAFLHSWTRSPWHLPYLDQVIYSDLGRANLRPDLTGRILDSTTLAIIGQKTVDVFPDHLDFAFYNRLNQHSRPSIQAYTTGFSPGLQQLNYDFYIGSEAPDYVLFEVKALRNPMYESYTQLALFQRYALVDTSFSSKGDTLLLLSRQNKQPLAERVLRPQEIPFGDWIELGNQTGFIPWLKADVSYSAWGNLRKFFLHPPKLWLEVRFADRSTQRWPVSLPTLSQGFPLLHLAKTADFIHWFSHKPEKLSQIEAVRWTSEQAGFADEMTYQKSFFEDPNGKIP